MPHLGPLRRYFRNLADIANTAQEASAPSQEQIGLFFQRVGEDATLTPEQVHAVASQLGIAKGVVAKVLSVGRFASAVSMDKFLFLLLVMSCESFAAVLQGLFKVFGETLDAQRFQAFIGYLAPDMVRKAPGEGGGQRPGRAQGPLCVPGMCHRPSGDGSQARAWWD